MTKEIVSISLGPAIRDYDMTARLLGEEFHIRRLGTDGDAACARDLVADFDGEVDAISLGGMSIHYRVGRRACVAEQVLDIARAASETPVVDGMHVKNTLERWALSQVAQDYPGFFSQKRVFIVSGIERYAMAQVLSAHTPLIRFGDLMVDWNVPFPLRSLGQFETYANLFLPALCRRPIGKRQVVEAGSEPGPIHGAEHLRRADVIVGDYGTICRMAGDGLHGKVVVCDSLSADDIQDLKERGVESLVVLTPSLSEEHPFVGASVIEAMLVSQFPRPLSGIADDDFLNLVAGSELQPQVVFLNKPPDVARFAFVIHPLSVDHIFNHPQLKYFRFLPDRLVERLMANIRPLYLSRIKGIRSEATGREAEGYLLGLGATPRELMRRKPGFTYRRLIVASRIAQQKGAKIMGLGAFTKVVGDAGMTVAYKSDIAITSGNSLTVVATLEAAKQAVIKMGGRVDKGRAVVIGATGSIGSVCSRLIAQAIEDVVLVAPRPEKLIPLKRTIEAETPGARVTIATNASAHLPEADLVVTTTTAIGQIVIDVLQLKPGCVVCDVARPPDVREEDARLRPDILVIESGEILLPGEPDYGFDMGLPPGVAYACLAEAAVLALEGRYENFTLGRNIEMDKVKEMYQLFKKHGLELEGLRSFGRYVTDDEVAAKRALADDLRQHPWKLDALVAASSGQEQVAAAQSPVVKRAVPLALAAVAAGMAAIAVAWIARRRRPD